MSNKNYDAAGMPAPAKQRNVRPRRRLSVDERREELLRVGMELFATRPYEEIWIEEIAQQAGISRGLLYHYFRTKRDFYVAVTRQAALQAAELAAPDASLAATDQLRAGIEAFVRYAEEHPEGFLTAWRGALAGDPEVREIGQQARERHTTRILEAVAGDNDPPALLQLAIQGWISLAQEIIARWLQEPDAPRDAVTELLARTLLGAISSSREIATRQMRYSVTKPVVR